MALWWLWVWGKTHYFIHRGKEGESGKSYRSLKSLKTAKIKCPWLFSNPTYTDVLPKILCQPSAANLPNSRHCLEIAVLKTVSSRQDDLFTTLRTCFRTIQTCPCAHVPPCHHHPSCLLLPLPPFRYIFQPSTIYPAPPSKGTPAVAVK